MTPEDFLHAARYGYAPEVKKALKKNPLLLHEVDDHQDTALDIAIIWGHTGVAEDIIAIHQEYVVPIPVKSLELARKFNRHQILEMI